MSTGHDDDKNKSRRTETRRRIILDGKEVEVVEITFTDIVEEDDPFDPPPPPSPGEGNRFDNVREWLSYLCNTFKPTERIVAYYFTIDQFPGGYTVLFTCNWKFDPADKEWIYYVDNELQDSHVLPAAEYKDLNREEALKKFVAELKAFSETEQFKQSFFANAKAVATGFFQEEIVMVK